MFFVQKKLSKMRVYKFGFSFIVLLFVFMSLDAQNTETVKAKKDSLLNKITDIDSKLKELSIKDTTMGFSAPLTIDTAYINRIQLENLRPLRDEKGLLLFSHDWVPFDLNVTFRDTVILDPVFLPVVFNGRLLPDSIDLTVRDSINELQTPPPAFCLISPDSTFAPLLKQAEHTRTMRQYYYLNNPGEVKLNALNFENSPVLKEEVVEKKNPFKELLNTSNPIEATRPDVEKIAIKPVYWIKSGSHTLNLSQQKFSDHWPGENNFNITSVQEFRLNYKKDKIYLNNVFTWRLSLQQMKADTVNKVNITDDLFRSYSAFGLNTFKNWSYSTTLDMTTPLFNRYAANDPSKTRHRAFLSPFELNLGVGMSYHKAIGSKTNKYRNFSITIDLSVLSLNYKNVRSDKVNETWFGVTKGYSDKLDYGSTYNLRMIYNRNRYTSFDTRIKYFTNYERVYVEWENTLRFKLNNYFNTSLYWYLKYDDSVLRNQQRDRWARFFAYYQNLGFGLSYNW